MLLLLLLSLLLVLLQKEPARQTNDQAVVSSAESSSLLKITHHSKTGVVHRLTPLVRENERETSTHKQNIYNYKPATIQHLFTCSVVMTTHTCMASYEHMVYT